MARVPRCLGAAMLTALLVSPLALTGATYRQHAKAPVVINVAGCWPDTYQGGQFVKIAESYNKVQSGIVVHATYGATVQQIVTAESGGKPPDIYFDCGNNDLGTWATNGVVYDLDSFIKKYHFDLNTLTSSARKLITFNGHVWAMPYLTDCYMLLWNKNLFKKAGLDPNKPPRTIEQVQALWKKLTLRDSSGKITSLAMLPTYGGPDFVGTYLPVYINMFGGQLVSNDGKTITANCTQCVQALTWEADYYKTIGASNIDHFGAYNNPSTGTPQNLFLTNKIAMYVSGEWNPQFIKQYGDPKHFSYGVAPLPVPASRGNVNVAEAGGNMGFIMRKAPHPEEAFKYLLWVQNLEPTVRFANVLNNVPQIKAALTSNQLDPNPYFRTFVHQAGVAQIQIFPNLPISAQYATELALVEDKVIHGKMTPKQGLDTVTSQMQSALDQQSNGL
jgi:multiple sugar transport system substrate-binding protein